MPPVVDIRDGSPLLVAVGYRDCPWYWFSAEKVFMPFAPWLTLLKALLPMLRDFWLPGAS